MSDTCDPSRSPLVPTRYHSTPRSPPSCVGPPNSYSRNSPLRKRVPLSKAGFADLGLGFLGWRTVDGLRSIFDASVYDGSYMPSPVGDSPPACRVPLRRLACGLTPAAEAAGAQPGSPVKLYLGIRGDGELRGGRRAGARRAGTEKSRRQKRQRERASTGTARTEVGVCAWGMRSWRPGLFL